MEGISLKCGVFCLLIHLTFAAIPMNGQGGTTANLQNVFVDRCRNFQGNHSDLFTDDAKNCTFLWNSFLNSFANKSSCEVYPESYSNFLRDANHTFAIQDKALFWSKVYPFVYNFKASRPGSYITIIDLLTGYVLDNLVWCWSLEKGSLDYDGCPSAAECIHGNEAVRSFWRANSETFARTATGRVYIMLNGSTTIGAYANNSILYTDEVANMNRTRISSVTVLLVRNLDKIPSSESCQTGTLLTLKGVFEEKGIKYECINDPPEVKALQCRLYPHYAEFCRSSPSGVSSVLFGSTVDSKLPPAVDARRV